MTRITTQKSLSCFTILFLYLFSAGLSLSQDDGLAQYRIANITVKGNKTYESGTIVSYSGLNLGEEINIPSDETREAISRLWNIGIFSDVQIYVEKKFGRDAYLVIAVEELPRVESVEIQGNDEFSSDEIKEKMGLTIGEVVSEQKLKDIAYNLKLDYQEEG